MEIQSFFLAGIVFLSVQSGSEARDQAFTKKVNENSGIQENFQHLFDSIATKDTEMSEIYRDVLKQEAAKRGQAFDAMKAEIRSVRKRNLSNRQNFQQKSNIDENIAAMIKRQVIPDHIKNYNTSGNKKKQEEVMGRLKELYGHEYRATTIKSEITKQPPFHKRLTYCAYLINEHIRFLERMISSSVLSKDDLKKYWQDTDPEKEEKNLMVIGKFDNLMKERVRQFLKRSRAVVDKCFNETVFGGPVLLDEVKDITAARDKNAQDAQKFLMNEMPIHLFKLIKDLKAFNFTEPLVNETETMGEGRTRAPNWKVDTS